MMQHVLFDRSPEAVTLEFLLPFMRLKFCVKQEGRKGKKKKFQLIKSTSLEFGIGTLDGKAKTPQPIS